MRGITLLYTLLACSTTIFAGVNVCPDTENDEPLRHEDCNKFYICKFSRPVEYRCYGDLLFNLETLQCDSPRNVDCEGRYITHANDVSSTYSTALEPSAAASKIVSRKKRFLPNGCPDTNIHWLLPHDTNCSLFYYCVWGDLVLRECHPGTHFNKALQVCDWPQNAKCSSSLQTNSNPMTPGITTTTPTTLESTTDKTISEPSNSESTTRQSSTPKIEFLPNGCPVNPHTHWLLPHETDCTMFYYCVWGDLVLRQCAPGTHFNRVLQVCDWPPNANCSTAGPSTLIPSTPEPTSPEPATPEPTTPGPSTVDPITPEPTTPEPTTPKTTTQELPTPKPTKPEFLPNGCPVNPHIHWLLPHETNCSLFYYCVWGDLVLRECAHGTHFNTVLQVCDWPQNANCSALLPTTPTPSTPEPTTPESATPEPTTSGLITPEPTTSGPTTLDPITSEPTTPKTTTQEPTTAKPTKPEFLPNGCPVNPHIHWLLPHETNCSLFYYCVWGALVVRECAPGTHFNSVLQVCDWPQNANCLASLPTAPTLPTPEPTTLESATPESTKPDPTTTEPTTPEPTTPGLITPEPTTPGLTTPDQITPEPTTPEPTKPAFLPNGCPVNPHIHWLLPHETNCSLFYYCVWGDLVLRECAPGTHFNSGLQVCDWPQNANCSASLPTTPTPSTPEPTTQELVTPEPTTREPPSPEPTTPGPTTPNPITPEPTTPEPTTPKTTTQEPTTPKPTKPEFLPNGCPVNPHIHWLLPHETNCSLFYYCVWGDLVLRECATGTHFNSILQVCDWPQNANCSASLPTTPTTSTPVPSTPESATPEQTTPAPTTPEPATPVPTPIEPTAPEQTTPQPTTPEFLPIPSTPEPTTQELVTPEPTTREPPSPEPTTPGPTTPNPITPEPTTPEPTTPKTTTQEPTTPKPTKPEFLPNGCPVNPHIHWLLPHETNCSLFYYCVWGALVLRECAHGTHFNSVLQVCDWPQNANCLASLPTTPTLPTPEPTTLESATPESTKPDPMTTEPTTPEPTTPGLITPEPTTPGLTTPDQITPEPTTPEPTKPASLPNGCPVNPHIHWLLPHETNCSLFYYCVWGDLVLTECAPGTHFNSVLQVCDWPQNANCSTSLPTTLTKSTPVPSTPESATPEQTTPAPTTPEPATPVPTPIEPTAPEQTTPQPTTSEFLPNGCPVNPHTHWLLPHETDCTMFYYCVWGDLVLRQCAPGTHFNRILQVCNWPQDAGCTPTLNKHMIGRRALLSL